MKTRLYNDTLCEGWQLRVDGNQLDGAVNITARTACGQGITITLSRRSQRALVSALAQHIAEHEAPDRDETFSEAIRRHEP